MGTLMAHSSGDTVDLLERARAGDQAALSEIFARHRDRLAHYIEKHWVCLPDELADTMRSNSWQVPRWKSSRWRKREGSPTTCRSGWCGRAGRRNRPG
jgi:hypothetical protein